VYQTTTRLNPQTLAAASPPPPPLALSLRDIKAHQPLLPRAVRRMALLPCLSPPQHGAAATLLTSFHPLLLAFRTVIVDITIRRRICHHVVAMWRLAGALHGHLAQTVTRR
jgi:hypothetical protein